MRFGTRSRMHGLALQQPDPQRNDTALWPTTTEDRAGAARPSAIKCCAQYTALPRQHPSLPTYQKSSSPAQGWYNDYIRITFRDTFRRRSLSFHPLPSPVPSHPEVLQCIRFLSESHIAIRVA